VIDLLVLASNPGSYNDKNINLPLQAGDVVNVPQAGTFFVYGAVKLRHLPADRRYSLTQALAKAGVGQGLSSSDIVIFRRKTEKNPERSIWMRI
jgi:hypothetical protein